ncbi:MAG: serine--tRNA ligase, partial [Nanoarchaeota archaeon]
MLNINKIRDNKEEVKKALLKRLKEGEFNLEKIISLDNNRKHLISEVELLKAERNKNSKTKPTPEIIEKMKTIGNEIQRLDGEIKMIEQTLKNILSELPNITADDVVAGGKENNKVLKQFGKKPKFSFRPKDHVQLATDLNLIDYERANYKTNPHNIV